MKAWLLSSDESKTWRGLACAIVFLASFAIRASSSWPYFFADYDPGKRNFERCDSSYQVRRTEIILQNYPQVPFHDSYHYFPDNPRIPWPAGYNLFLATLVKPVDMLYRSTILTETMLGFIPCLLDSITLLLFLFLFSRLLSFETALIASLLYAFSFVNVQYSELGCIDHHYFITLMVAAIATLLYRFERVPNRKRGLVLGAAIGLTIFFNVSSIQYALLFLLTLLLLCLRKEASTEFRKNSLWVYLASGLISILASLSTPAGRMLQIRYDETSLFQPLTILVAGAGSAGILLRYRRRLVFSLVAGVIGLAVLLYANTLEGARFLLLGNMLNGIQAEEESILRYADGFHLIVTWCAILVPLGIASFWKKRKSHTFLFVLLAVFFLYGMLCALAHWAYIQFFYPWYAIVAAEGFMLLARGPRLQKHRVARAVLCAVFILQPLYVVTFYSLNLAQPRVPLWNQLKEQIQAFTWLGRHSATTSNQFPGDGEPEYSVFANRDIGHLVIRHAGRPVIASPFSTPDFLPHMIDYARYAFSKSEQEVLELMERYRSRYLIVDNTDNGMQDFYLRLLQAARPAVYHQYLPAADPSREHLLFRNALLYFDGDISGGKPLPPEHLRLIYETPGKSSIKIVIAGQPRTISYHWLKIYEKVIGARFSVEHLNSSDAVELQVLVQTNAGRLLTFHHRASADARGIVECVVPYAASGKDIEIRVNGRRLESFDNRLAISEQDVMEGRRVVLHAGT